jgi:para-nitrobenzyl esterase
LFRTSILFRGLCLFLFALLFVLSFSVNEQYEQAKAAGITKESTSSSPTGAAIDGPLPQVPSETPEAPGTSTAITQDVPPDVDGPVIARPPVGAFSGVRSLGVSLYRGIPYAMPPVGELRFAPPEAVPTHSGIVRCDDYGPTAIQKTPVDNLPMSEDCLTLNIWTPAAKADAALPVYVYFHGGAFVHGSGGALRNDGTAFARDGVLFVSINYRLGSLGFYASQETFDRYGTTGNWGLLDQICALEWVQKNIAAFGGDPRKVTIGGHSAGAFSVGGLLLSPRTAGLFRSAILDSGTLLGLPALNPKNSGNLDRAIAVSKDVYPDTLSVLRALPVEDLLSPVTYYGDFVHHNNRFFTPVLDGSVLPKEPGACLDSGDFRPVNLLIGDTTDEASTFIPENTNAADYRRLMERYYGTFGAEKVLAAYPVTQEMPAVRQARRLFTIACFSGGSLRYADAFTAAGARVYLYRFSYVSESNRARNLGAQHGAGLPFVFDNLSGFGFQHPSVAEKNLATAMHGAWVNFIKYGNPTPAIGSAIPSNGTTETSDWVWPPYSSATHLAADFGEQIHTGPLPNWEDIAFLNGLAP